LYLEVRGIPDKAYKLLLLINIGTPQVGEIMSINKVFSINRKSLIILLTTIFIISSIFTTPLIAIPIYAQTGSITIRIHNAPGMSMPGSGGNITVELYKWDSSSRVWNKVDVKSVNYQPNVNYVTVSFTGTELNKYYTYRVYHKPSIGLKLEEFWGWGQIFILTSSNSSATIDFYRSRPIIRSVDPTYPTTVSINSEIRFKLTVKNLDTRSRDLYLTAILDRDLSRPLDVAINTSSFTLNPGEERSITVTIRTPSIPGVYIPYFVLRFYNPQDPSSHGTVYDQWDGTWRKINVTTPLSCEARLDLSNFNEGEVQLDVARCSDVTGDGRRDAYVYINVPDGISRLQVTMSVEKDDDIDMRLYNPRGSVAGESTAGTGESERIAIDNPAPGVWKLHVYEYRIGGSTANVRVEARVERGATPKVERLEILDAPASGSVLVHLLRDRGYAAEVILLIPSGASELSIKLSPRGEGSMKLDVYLYDPRGRTIYEGRELVVSSQNPISIKVPSPMGGEWKLYIRGRDFGAIDVLFRLPVLLKEVEIDRDRVIKVMLDRSGYHPHRVGEKDLYTLSIGVYYKGRDKLVGEGEDNIGGITLKKALITLWTDRREGSNVYFDGTCIIFTYHPKDIKKPTYMPIDYKKSIEDELMEQRFMSLLTSSLLQLASLGLAQIPIIITRGGQAVEIGSAGSIFDLFNFISGVLGINKEEVLGPAPPSLDINRYTIINVPVFLAFGEQKTSYVEANFYIEWYKPGVNEVKFWVGIKLDVPLTRGWLDRWIMEPAEYTLRVNVAR